MPSDPRKECPSCLRPTASADDWKMTEPGGGTHLCWGGRECYTRLCAMQAVAPDMVRVLERTLDAVFTKDLGAAATTLEADIEKLLSRAKGDPQ